MEASAPVASDAWSYLKSTRVFSDFIEVAQSIKDIVYETGYRMFYTTCERRVAAVQNKDRPELEKIGWDSLNYARTFKLPPLEDKMIRVDGKTVTVEEFREKYERPRVPCVITGLTDKWKARQNWTFQKLTREYGNSYFKCAEHRKGRPVFLKFKYFAEYMRENEDDSPLYIVDDFHGEDRSAKEMLEDYEVPPYFSDDLLNILGEDVKRLRHRWVAIGPARSGTTIHVNPLNTSSWTSLIHGHKRWVLIHPDTAKELVYVPKDQRGIHPQEAITWFSTVYKRIRQGDWPFDKYPVLECRQRPGETVFVPYGWWNAEINEDETFAVRHNFCSPINLPQVYPALRRQNPNLARIFLERLNEMRAELLTIVNQTMLDSAPFEDETNKSGAGQNEDDDSTSYTSTTDLSASESESDSSDEEEEEEDDSSEDEDVKDGKKLIKAQPSSGRGDQKADSDEDTDSRDESSSEIDSEEGDESEESSECDDIFRKPIRMESPIRTPPTGVKCRAVAARVNIPARYGESDA
nr:Transcription factor jumonji domain containing protein [Haemonchus contortus]